MKENSINRIKNNKEKDIKLLNPKTDIVFQWLFSNPNITKGLISSLIDEKITDIEIDLNKQVLGESITDKTGILDLRAKINNTVECEIEMQMLYSKNFIPRLLYYWSRLYSKQLKRGNNYNELHKTICIAIINQDIPYLQELKAHTKWQIREEKNKTKILTENLEIHIIEIQKAIKEYDKDRKNKILQWMMFLNEPGSMEVDRIMEKNEEIKEAKVTLRELSEEESKQQIAELREKYILDTKDIFETGIEKGISDEKINIAKKLLKINMPIKQISEITGLNEKEIKEL